jgi:hypothetical protein
MRQTRIRDDMLYDGAAIVRSRLAAPVIDSSA